MPLKSGGGHEIISENIAELINAGHDPKQAAAIAYKKARGEDASVIARFYVEEKLGEKQSLTPEGFLVCHDVPISRVGELVYLAKELPLVPGPDGLIYVDRHAED